MNRNSGFHFSNLGNKERIETSGSEYRPRSDRVLQIRSNPVEIVGFLLLSDGGRQDIAETDCSRTLNAVSFESLRFTGALVGVLLVGLELGDLVGGFVGEKDALVVSPTRSPSIKPTSKTPTKSFAPTKSPTRSPSSKPMVGEKDLVGVLLVGLEEGDLVGVFVGEKDFVGVLLVGLELGDLVKDLVGASLVG